MNAMRQSMIFPTGSSLVEILVTLVLLSLGLLGASKMHIASLRAQHESSLATRATQLAASMAERLRANHVIMAAADADNPYLDVDYQAAGAVSETGGALACFGAVNCSAAQLAQFDLDEWREQLRTALPGARLRICRDLPNMDAAASGASWACSAASHAPVVIKLGWRGRTVDGQAGAAGVAGVADDADGPKLVWQVMGGTP